MTQFLLLFLQAFERRLQIGKTGTGEQYFGYGHSVLLFLSDPTVGPITICYFFCSKSNFLISQGKQEIPKIRDFQSMVRRSGLEPLIPEGGRFTVSWNSRYPTDA